MSTPKDKHLILAVESQNLPGSLQKGASGVYDMPREDVFLTLTRAGPWFGQRGVLEHDPRFRQIIPYVLLRQDGKVLTYTRPGDINETRLATKSSIGFGGHVDISDAVLSFVQEDSNQLQTNLPPTIDVERVVKTAAMRECCEELGIAVHDFVTNERTIGLLVDNHSEVGAVHIGVVEVWDTEEMDLGDLHQQEEVLEVAWKTLDELKAVRGTLEFWSAAALDILIAEAADVAPEPEPAAPVARTRKRASSEEQLADAE